MWAVPLFPWSLKQEAIKRTRRTITMHIQEARCISLPQILEKNKSFSSFTFAQVRKVQWEKLGTTLQILGNISGALNTYRFANCVLINSNGISSSTGTINQSLLTLGRVITSLVERAPHIPYRYTSQWDDIFLCMHGIIILKKSF